MKRKITFSLMFVLIWIVAGTSLAASGKCKVVKIFENQMIIECDNPEKGFKQGDVIKIKTVSNQGKVEGC